MSLWNTVGVLFLLIFMALAHLAPFFLQAHSGQQICGPLLWGKGRVLIRLHHDVLRLFVFVQAPLIPPVQIGHIAVKADR